VVVQRPLLFNGLPNWLCSGSRVPFGLFVVFADSKLPTPTLETFLDSGGSSYEPNCIQSIPGIGTRPDLSILPPTATPPKLFLISWITVVPGRTQEFESFIKNDMLPVIKRAQVPGYLVSQVLFGGATNQYVLLTGRDSYADLDKGLPWEQVLGREGASKLLQKGAPYISHGERSIVRFVPELSIMPAVQAEMK